jgi:hypothetical protein
MSGPLHGITVIDDFELLDATTLHFHFDHFGASVEAVLEQLLEGCGRAIDDLARGDLVDQQFIEFADGGHQKRSCGCANYSAHIRR